VAAPVAEVPQQAAVVENVVPQAATDGADLQPTAQGWSGLQSLLVAAGALLLLAAGLLSARRPEKE
jgi:LPXTG-motif cell wall-anchored protein